jgi:Replication-relaxation
MKGITTGAVKPQERDFAILRGLFESRVMTASHTAALYFDGRMESARKRLQKLKQAGLIRDRLRHYFEPRALVLTTKGFDVLKRHNQLGGFPVITDAEFEARSRVSPLTLRHELECASVKAALHSALARLPDTFKIECTTWPLMCQFRARLPSASGYGATSVIVKPDGFLSFHQRDADGIAEHCFYLEVDRGTAAQKVLAERAACYRAHYRSGNFAESRGGTREEFEQYPFRVLAVFKTAERRNNAAERLLAINPPLKTMVWLTTMPEMLRDPLGPIWVQPADYQEVIARSGHQVSAPRLLGGYRRQTERDAIVSELVKKNKLLNI